MSDLHRLLSRQLHKLGASADSPPSAADWPELLRRISSHYSQADNDRYLLERSLDRVSSEMQELYDQHRRSSETQLAAERDKLQAIITSVGEGLASLDRRGQLLSLNPAGEAMLGRAAAPELGGELLLRIGEREADLLGGQPREGEARFARPGYGEFTASYRLNPVHQAGALAGWVLTFRDVTAQKELEEQLRRAHSEAQQASRLKSEFLANTSHEIRTPINAILGFTGLLLDSGLDEERRELAELAHASGKNLLAILNDILDLSKIEAGRLELSCGRFSLRELLDGVVGMFSERVVSRGLRLTCRVHPGVPDALEGDALRLRQVLVNLVGNALKFTDRGEIDVEADGEADGEGRYRLRVGVRDTGIGIPAPDQARLFQAFTQVDGSSSRRFEGTGLGLAICRQLVEMMGGSIRVESAENQGSSFRFEAVLRPAEEPQAPPLAGYRVLVVEAHAPTRAALESHLRFAGAEVESSGSGVDAVSMACARGGSPPADAIVLASDLPDMDSLVLARVLRAAAPAASLLLEVPFGRSAPAEPALDACIALPLRYQQLVDCLRRPAAAAPAAPDPDDALGSPLSGDAAAECPSFLRVLIVEDNVVNQRLAVRLLERLGLRGDVAANGQEALDALSLLRYDVVLMDCMMPGMDGYEATRRIRARETDARRVPIIAMTANAMNGDREKCLSIGMDDYVTKPIDPAEFARALERWLPLSGRFAA